MFLQGHDRLILLRHEIRSAHLENSDICSIVVRELPPPIEQMSELRGPDERSEIRGPFDPHFARAPCGLRSFMSHAIPRLLLVAGGVRAVRISDWLARHAVIGYRFTTEEQAEWRIAASNNRVIGVLD
jgi:hypothetical protein